MKKHMTACWLGVIIMLMFSGCEMTNNKTADLSMVYAVTALLALAVLVCYFFLAKKKETWYLVLFSSVFVVNVGYLWLSLSSSLNSALMANRFAYLGSVFLPLSMFMIILNTAKIDCKRWVLYLLLGISGVVFLVAASQGYLDVYYKEVSLETIGGFSALKKVYGPLHSLYLVYLVGYFAAMIYAIIYAFRKKSSENTVYTVILAMAVFVNIGVWFVEQIVSIDFEVLSVSYIISEMFLLGLNLLMAEHNKQKTQPKEQTVINVSTPKPEINDEQLELFKLGLADLTKTEKIIYESYVEGKTTKEVMEILNIKENTLKFHNKNIYSKLGVSSRKQLVEISKAL